MSRDGSVGSVEGRARLLSPLVTWELARVGGMGGEAVCPGARVDMAGHGGAVQCRTRELTFTSTLLSLAWLLFK